MEKELQLCNGVDHYEKVQWRMCPKRKTCLHWLKAEGLERRTFPSWLCDENFNMYIEDKKGS